MPSTYPKTYHIQREIQQNCMLLREHFSKGSLQPIKMVASIAYIGSFIEIFFSALRWFCGVSTNFGRQITWRSLVSLHWFKCSYERFCEDYRRMKWSYTCIRIYCAIIPSFFRSGSLNINMINKYMCERVELIVNTFAQSEQTLFARQYHQQRCAVCNLRICVSMSSTCIGCTSDPVLDCLNQRGRT